MKHTTLLTQLFAVVLFSLTSCHKDDVKPYNPDGSLITKEQAIELIQDLFEEYNNNQIFMYDAIIEGRRSYVVDYRYSFTPKSDCWLFAIDAIPTANGGLKFLFVEIDVISGERTISKSMGITLNVDCDITMLQGMTIPNNTSSSISCPKPITKSAISPSVSYNKWAVIISGGVSPRYNYIRYWNDCQFIYKTLTQQYSYNKDNVFVIMADGNSPGLDRNCYGYYDSSPTDLDNDGEGDINYSASLSNISTVFNTLQSSVAPNDIVFIFVIDHGSLNNEQESQIELWNGETMGVSRFSQELSKIPWGAKTHILMGQCFSGGFLDSLVGQNKTIATACGPTELSSADSDLQYDTFARLWTSAMAEQTTLGTPICIDYDGYEGVSAQEAFIYATSNDGNDEHPQYSSTPSSFGLQFGLSGINLGYPVLSGASDVSSSQNAVIFLSGLPSEGNVSWSSSPSIDISYQTSSSVSIYGQNNMPYDNAGYISATITTPFTSYVITKSILVWGEGVFYNSDFLAQNSNSFSVKNCPDGAYDFWWGCEDPEAIIDCQGLPYTAVYYPSHITPPNRTTVWISFRNPFGAQIILTKDVDNTFF